MGTWEGDTKKKKSKHKKLLSINENKLNPKWTIAPKAKKFQLSATLDFLNHLRFKTAKEIYKKALVDTLVDNIAEKFSSTFSPLIFQVKSP